MNILSSVLIPLLPNAKGEHDATARRDKAEQANLNALEFPNVVRALDLLEFLDVADLADIGEPFEQDVELAAIIRIQRIEEVAGGTGSIRERQRLDCEVRPLEFRRSGQSSVLLGPSVAFVSGLSVS